MVSAPVASEGRGHPVRHVPDCPLGVLQMCMVAPVLRLLKGGGKLMKMLEERRQGVPDDKSETGKSEGTKSATSKVGVASLTLCDSHVMPRPDAWKSCHLIDTSAL